MRSWWYHTYGRGVGTGNRAGGDVTRGGAIRGPGAGTGMTWWCYGDWASGDVTGDRAIRGPSDVMEMGLLLRRWGRWCNHGKWGYSLSW